MHPVLRAVLQALVEWLATSLWAGPVVPVPPVPPQGLDWPLVVFALGTVSLCWFIRWVEGPRAHRRLRERWDER